MVDSTKKLPYSASVVFLVFSIFFLIIGAINIILYSIASSNKQPNPPITYDTSIIMIILNVVIVLLALGVMIFMIYKIHGVHSHNTISDFENLRATGGRDKCSNVFSGKEAAKCQQYYDEHQYAPSSQEIEMMALST